jgi:hypothetical protein
MQYLKGRLRLYQTNRRKIAYRHSDMHHPNPHQTEAGQTLDLRLANTVTHLLSPRRINTSNSKSRQCALPNRPSSNKHLSDPSQQGNPATHSSNSSSNKCKRLWCRRYHSKPHHHKLPRLVLRPDQGRDHDSQSPTLRLSAS